MGESRYYGGQVEVSSRASRAAESSAPHSNKVERGNSEMDGGRGSEGASGCGNMEKVKKI